MPASRKLSAISDWLFNADDNAAVVGVCWGLVIVEHFGLSILPIPVVWTVLLVVGLIREALSDG